MDALVFTIVDVTQLLLAPSTGAAREQNRRLGPTHNVRHQCALNQKLSSYTSLLHKSTLSASLTVIDSSNRIVSSAHALNC